MQPQYGAPLAMVVPAGRPPPPSAALPGMWGGGDTTHGPPPRYFPAFRVPGSAPAPPLVCRSPVEQSGGFPLLCSFHQIGGWVEYFLPQCSSGVKPAMFGVPLGGGYGGHTHTRSPGASGPLPYPTVPLRPRRTALSGAFLDPPNDPKVEDAPSQGAMGPTRGVLSPFSSPLHRPRGQGAASPAAGRRRGAAVGSDARRWL